MNLIVKSILVAMLTISLAACVTRQGNFTVLSDQLVNTKNFDVGHAQKLGHVKGEEIKSIIILFPTGVPTFQGAIDDALRKSGGDVLTNAVVSSYYWWIPYIYGQSGWTVEGDAIKTREN